jgi:hypothetical protein
LNSGGIRGCLLTQRRIGVRVAARQPTLLRHAFPCFLRRTHLLARA